MHQVFKKSETVGAVFAIITGTLLHFVYDWSNHDPLVAIFAPYNESVWEHLKLVYYPVVLYTIFQYFFIGRRYRGFLTGKLLGILAGMAAIVIIFCLYFSIVGHSILWIDIPLFFLSIALCYIVSYHFTIRKRWPVYLDLISVLLMACLFMCFYIFTFLPPRHFLFQG